VEQSSESYLVEEGSIATTRTNVANYQNGANFEA